ncbi:MAG TPA: DNA polymerase III subunit epsilon [Casimicrobiaceae bacterium]|nr:DNA polymerase III subunit epsilon [Casimicrobiaceae bacterium]
MRQIILDTETTGLDPKHGHRIIEIAGVEVVDRRPTGRHVHFYLNPERDVDAAATEVHGMTWEDLHARPKFRDVVAEFLDFARGAEWIIHNAPFDVAFLDHEFALCGHCACGEVYGKLTDTLSLAREQFPGKRNSLDALCERFGVDNAQRALHGALLDARLLADVYLSMTRGQESLTIDIVQGAVVSRRSSETFDRARTLLIVTLPSAEELAMHDAYLEALDRESKGRCVWLTMQRAAAA